MGFLDTLMCQSNPQGKEQPNARTTTVANLVNIEKKRNGSVRGDGYSSKDLDFTMFKEAFIAKNNKIEKLDKTLEDLQGQLKILNELVIAAEAKLEGLDRLQQFADSLQEELRVTKAERDSTATKLGQVEALNASLATDVASLSWKLQEIQTAPVHTLTPQASPRNEKGSSSDLAAVMARYETASAHEMHLPSQTAAASWISPDKGKGQPRQTLESVSSFHLRSALNALQSSGSVVDYNNELYSPRGERG